jgi:Curli production assembly/transport component CsgG
MCAIALSKVCLLGIALLLPACTITLKSPTTMRAQGTSSPAFNPQNITKLAVLVVNERNYRVLRQADRLIEDEIIPVLLGKGYSIASRSDAKAIRDELKFQRESGLTDEDASRIGKMLNVPAVLIVSINQYETGRTRPIKLGRRTYSHYVTHATMGARLISVETGEILWLGKHSDDYSSEDRHNTEALAQLSRTIASAFPSRVGQDLHR